MKGDAEKAPREGKGAEGREGGGRGEHSEESVKKKSEKNVGEREREEERGGRSKEEKQSVMVSFAEELEVIGNEVLLGETMVISEVVSRSLTECDPSSEGKRVHQQVEGGKEEKGTVMARGGHLKRRARAKNSLEIKVCLPMGHKRSTGGEGKGSRGREQ